jgi:hypothetical protein
MASGWDAQGGERGREWVRVDCKRGPSVCPTTVSLHFSHRSKVSRCLVCKRESVWRRGEKGNKRKEESIWTRAYEGRISPAFILLFGGKASLPQPLSIPCGNNITPSSSGKLPPLHVPAPHSSLVLAGRLSKLDWTTLGLNGTVAGHN